MGPSPTSSSATNSSGIRPTNPRGGARRSKTFTGCWTCRYRSVKCDEARPLCQRCSLSGVRCEGYGVRLSWPDEHTAKQGGSGRRRLFAAPSLAGLPLMTEVDLDLDLQTLDGVSHQHQRTIGLFSVFSVQLPAEIVDTSPYATSRTSIGSEAAEFQLDSSIVPENNYAAHEVPVANSDNSTNEPGILHDIVNSEERGELLHLWTSRFSQIMSPIPQHGNIWTNIITPLALQALNEYNASHAHLALLHAILALTVFWKESLMSEQFTDLGTKYLNSSLNLLTKCLEAPKYPQVIIATIGTLLIIPAFNGEDSDWRIHVRGGVAWLQSVDVSTWTDSLSSIMLFQNFSFCEALSPASSCMRTSNTESYMVQLDQVSVLHAEWYLDKSWGITGELIEIIRQINVFVYSSRHSPKELDELELRLHRSDPTYHRFPGLDQEFEELAQQHACLFYCATHLYFLRCLRHVPVEAVQHLVRSSLGHIRRISALEEKYDTSGVLWPYFVVACEALGTEARLTLMRYFDYRQSLGIRNTGSVKRAVLAVWDERDMPSEVDLSWYDILARDGIDMLLL